MPKLDIINANNVVEYNPKKAFFQIKNLGGPKGDKGDRGEPGAGLKITDSVATYQDLPTTLEYIDAGSAYVVRSDGQLYIWNGYEFPAEGHGAQFEGPQGPQGEPGRNGTDGRDGTDGTDGFSPEATVEQVGAGARITITDKDGTTTADVAGFTVDDALSDSSTNPVQNKVVKGALDGKQATLGAGDISTSLIADEAVTEAKIDSALIDELFYKPGDVIESERIAMGVATFNGALTGGNQNFYMAIPVAKSLANISTATINAMQGPVRGGTGGYLNNMNTDYSDLVPKCSSMTATVDKGSNQIYVVFTRSSGWGGTNNATYNMQVQYYKITLS